jgi:hypothetical protein
VLKKGFFLFIDFQQFKPGIFKTIVTKRVRVKQDKKYNIGTLKNIKIFILRCNGTT